MVTVLTRDEWMARASQHRSVATEITAAVRLRKQAGERHPIEDFLWEYYSNKPAQFERWHPGAEFALEDAPEYAEVKGYESSAGVTAVSLDFIRERSTALQWMVDLLQGSLDRTARFQCFGLHEWAMVYRLSQEEVRHEQAPLRLSPEEIAEVVEAQELKCTHYDAFRFYVPEARSLNHMVLERTDQISMEQSGCLHANMDLYKWCYKAKPIIDSDLMLRCFVLAKEIRTLDMQAAPYELSAWGLTPVPIETAEGRAEYARQQRNFSERANELRVELRDKLIAALAAANI